MTEREILDHLEDICATKDFKRSSQCSGFLRYVVGETLAGRIDRIKAYAIAVSVWGVTRISILSCVSKPVSFGPVAPEAVLDDQNAIADAIVRQMALPSNS